MASTTLLIDLLESLRSSDLNCMNERLQAVKKVLSDKNQQVAKSSSLVCPPLSSVDCNNSLGPQDITKKKKQGYHDNNAPWLQMYQHPTTLNIIPNNLSNESAKKVNFCEILDTIWRLLWTFPSIACNPRNSDGVLPLHIAALIGDASLGSLIASACPEATSVQNKKGKTPLHFAAREGHLEMVTLLLKINPSSATILTKKLKLPLHFAASEGHAQICHLLLEVFPGGAAIRSDKGKLPLHLASKDGNMDTLNVLLRIYPIGSQLLDWESSPPLHIALRQGKINVARHFIRFYPEALLLKNIDGEYPLDIALRNFSLNLVAEMVTICPKIAINTLQKIKDNHDIDEWEWDKVELCLRGAVGLFENTEWSSLRTATFCSCHLKEMRECTKTTLTDKNDPIPPFIVHGKKRQRVSREGKKADKNQCKNENDYHQKFWDRKQPLLLGDIPNIIASFPRKRKFFPLHAALEVGASPSVIRYVLRKFPDHLSKEDEFMQLPLHLAGLYCTTRERAEITRNDILAGNVEGANHRDLFGRLPLHVALCNDADTTFVQALLKASPSSGHAKCMTKDKEFENEIPLFMATEFDCSIDTVYSLLRGDPNVANHLLQFED